MQESKSTGAADRAREVEAVLARLRAGIRQRTGERALLEGDTLLGPEAGGLGGLSARELALRQRLDALRAAEFLHDPPLEARAPLVGPLMRWLRRALFRYGLRWYLHPIVQQQNEYNRELRETLEELAEGQRALARELERARRGPRRPA